MNPFSPPRESSDCVEKRATPSLGASIHPANLVAFWLGSTSASLASSWVLSRDYVFVEWADDWTLALLRTFLIALVPLCVYQAVRWWQSARVLTLGNFVIGFLLIFTTDLISNFLFDVLRRVFPESHFRYPAVCFLVLLPLTFAVTIVVGEFNRRVDE